jgi:hypothetical protein
VSAGERFRVRRAVRYRVVGLEAVVVRQDTAEVMVLNEVGARTLVLLAEGRTAAEIAQRLADEFEVAAENAHADVLDYVRELLEAGVIEPAP